MDSTISTTFLHAITFLLSPLSSHYPSQVLDALHLALLSSFSRLDISSRPQTLLLSPTAPPPPSVFFALQSLQSFPVDVRVHWTDWMLLLGNGSQLVLTIIAGCVQVMVRDPTTGGMTTQTVWNANLQTRAASPWGCSIRSRSSAPSSSESSSDSVSSRSSSPVVEDVIAVEAAENVLNGLDDEEDHVVGFTGRGMGFAVSPILTKSTALSAAAPEWHPSIAVRPPHGKTASVTSFGSFTPQPQPPLAAKQQPVGAGKRAQFQYHSRASSRSSTMSSAPSLVSSYSSNSSGTINTAALTNTLASLSLRSKTPSALSNQSTGTSASLSVPAPATSALVPASPTPSDISDSADATFYLDGTKDQQAVTEYECGKVGVLTGAVMLGVPRGAKSVRVVAGKTGARRA